MERNAWPYVAGIFDGGGSISIHKANGVGNSSYRLQIVIYNTSIPLMKWLLGNFGGTFYSRDNNPSGWGKTYHSKICKWTISGRKNKERFLLGILPYLIIKSEQVKVGLEFLRLENDRVPEIRKQLEEQIKLLNRRGSSVTTNTQDASQEAKRESELVSDHESGLMVTSESH